jgi:hypothetical protein
MQLPRNFGDRADLFAFFVFGLSFAAASAAALAASAFCCMAVLLLVSRNLTGSIGFAFFLQLSSCASECPLFQQQYNTSPSDHEHLLFPCRIIPLVT